MRIWDASTGEQLAAFFGGGDNQWLTMTPSGFFAASRTGTQMLSVVRGLEPFSVNRGTVGKVKEQWGKLTDDELTQINGNREQLEGKLQAKYGYVKDKAKQEVDDWCNRAK